eukprot:Clim_evm75s147 gene=Clim_evmTU75s147
MGACVTITFTVLFGFLALILGILVPHQLDRTIMGYEPYNIDKCKQVADGAYGSEDLQFIPPSVDEYNAPREVAILSSDNRIAYFTPGEPPKYHLVGLGNLFSYDIRTGETKKIRMTGIDLNSYPFHPHGISVGDKRQGYAGNYNRLWVVNHTDEGDEVLIFHYHFSPEDRSIHLQLIHRVRDPRWFDSNDIVAISDCQAYMTQWRGVDRRIDPMGGLVEQLLKQKKTKIWFIDFCEEMTAPKVRTVFDEIGGANGITLWNGKIVVAEVWAHRILVFDRDPKTNGLTLSYHVDLDRSLPDNLDVGDDGKIYIGSHPSFVDFLLHGLTSFQRPAPMEAKAVTLDGDKSVVEQLLLHSGDSNFGCSATAAFTRVDGQRHVVIGSVTSNGLLDCII